MDSEDTARNLLELMLFDESVEPTHMPLSLLKSITNNFSNDREIGVGGFAVVYKGLLQKGTVAVKKLTQILDEHEKKFHQEIDSLMRVKHKNIVRFLGYCSDTQGKVWKVGAKNVMAEERQRFLCFEFLPEGSLDKYISDASQGLEWIRRYQIIKGICEGLHYLHQQKIVHSDLKPANILLDGYKLPKIADFGLSKCFEENQTRAVTLNVFGSLGYMAPESYGGQITFKSDIYSLGIIIIEILTGQKGFPNIENVLQSWTARFGTPQGDVQLEPVRICAEIGIECTDFNPSKRPDTGRIMGRLEEMENTYDFIKTELATFSTTKNEQTHSDKDDNPALESAGSDELKLEIMARTNSLPSTRHDGFPVLVRVMAPLRYPCIGLDLVAVLPVSKSMRGHRLESMKQGILFVIDNLRPNDRLSIVTFSDHPQRHTELSVMSDENRERARNVVLKLQPEGGTDMHKAMREAAKILRQRGPVKRRNRVGRIFFLSDGEENGVVHDHEVLRYIVDPEFPVETFGLSSSHDPKVLHYIADRTAGIYSFVNKDLKQIKDAFAQSLGGLMSVTAMDVQVNLQTLDGVAISSIKSGKYCNSISLDKGSGTIQIPDLYAGEQKNFIVYLTVLEGNIQKLMIASGQYRNPKSAIQINASEVVVQRTTVTTPSDDQIKTICPDVAAELVRQQLVAEMMCMAEIIYLGFSYSQNNNKLESRWAKIKSSLDGCSAPRSALMVLDNDVTDMQDKKEGKPFMLSWLTSHLWQRATTKGSPHKSSAFRVNAMEEMINKLN